MYLYFATKILFFFLVEFTAVEEVHSTNETRLENDITKPLNKWFASIFSIEANTVNEIPNCVTNYYNDNYTYNSRNAVSCFRSMNLRYIGFGKTDRYAFPSENASTSAEASSPAQVDFNFSTKQLQLLYQKMIFKMIGELHLEYNNTSADFAFNAEISLGNVSIIVFESPSSSNQSNHMKISHNFSYGEISTIFKSKTGRTIPLLPDERHEDLKREIPLILRKRYNNNPKFLQSLNEIFQSIVAPKNELLSNQSDLPNSPEKFHYLITNIPSSWSTLKCIVITGLSNLDTFKIEKSSDIFTHTLLIKNIAGNMTSDCGTENGTSLEMHFKIDHLYVIKKEINNTSTVCVNAKYWQINPANVNSSLNDHQSEVMMHSLELTIVSSILPSMRVEKVSDIGTPPEDIQITNTSDWKTIKQSYKGSIPFNEDTNNTISYKVHFNVSDH